MRSLLVTTLLAAALSGSAFAADVDKTIDLKDGSSVVVFKDGKMQMRNKSGNTVSMKDGVAMETKDGKTIMMKGNELWRRTSAEEILGKPY